MGDRLRTVRRHWAVMRLRRELGRWEAFGRAARAVGVSFDQAAAAMRRLAEAHITS